MRLFVITVIVVSALVQSALARSDQSAALQSHLAQIDNDPGVYRYIEGDGSIAAVTLSAELSRTGDRFVILVATTPKHEVQAVAHGKKLAAWFEENIEDVSSVPVIIYPNTKGVGYTFHISGVRFFQEGFESSNGIMSPQETVASLEKAALTHKAREVIRERGDKYSEVFD